MLVTKARPSKKTNPATKSTQKKFTTQRGAVGVVLLVEKLLPAPEIRSLNPDIGKILSTNCTIDKEKEAGNGPSLKKKFIKRGKQCEGINL